MFAKLTNALPSLKGEPLLINPTAIIAVHRNKVIREDGNEEPVTYVSTHNLNWEVEEEVDVVLELFNRALKGK